VAGAPADVEEKAYGQEKQASRIITDLQPSVWGAGKEVGAWLSIMWKGSP